MCQIKKVKWFLFLGKTLNTQVLHRFARCCPLVLPWCRAPWCLGNPRRGNTATSRKERECGHCLKEPQQEREGKQPQPKGEEGRGKAATREPQQGTGKAATTERSRERARHHVFKRRGTATATKKRGAGRRRSPPQKKVRGR